MKYQKNVMRSLAYFFQVGIGMIVPIMLCLFLGMFLDRVFHTSFIVIILFFVGAISGFRNIFLFAKNNSGKRSYLGSDSDRKIDEMVREASSCDREDFVQKMDRIYRENMNEQAQDNPYRE